MSNQLSNTSSDLSLMVNDLSDRVTKLCDNSSDMKLIKGLTDGPVAFVGAVTQLILKIPTDLLKTRLQLAENNIELELVLSKSENVVEELNAKIPEENWSSFFNSNNLLPILSQVLEEFKMHKKVYELFQKKHGKYYKKLLEIFGEVTQDYSPENFSISRIDEHMSNINQILSHDKFYESTLALEILKNRSVQYYVDYQKDQSNSQHKLNESRFHFLWYLCYLRITESDDGLMRGMGIPQELYKQFSPGLKSSFARGWNNFKNDFSTSAAAEQSKYKSYINKQVPDLIELNVDHYCLNRKINKKDINIPHL